jgi:hypothetical protein
MIPPTEDLYLTEHERGLHDAVARAYCPSCAGRTVTAPVRPIDAVPVSAPAPRVPGWTALGDAIENLRRKRGGHLFGDGAPPEPPESPDGNPYCETCRGARTVAIRVPNAPTVYERCPTCRNAPWLIQQRIDRLLGELPLMFRHWRLQTFPDVCQAQHSTLEMMLEWRDDTEPSWLFLWGPSGRGKTGLAVSLLFELASMGLSAGFKVVPDLLSIIKATFGVSDGESESSILETLIAADVLCLDDLGSEYHRGGEDWAAEKLFQVISGRHAALKRTIITSNYSLEQLKERLGHPRTVRRIFEMTGTRFAIDMRPLPSLSDLSYSSRGPDRRGGS